jgi:hypothetical protein
MDVEWAGELPCSNRRVTYQSAPTGLGGEISKSRGQREVSFSNKDRSRCHVRVLFPVPQILLIY